MRFMYLWQAPDWPNFRVDLAALQPVLSAVRLAQGRALGMAGQLQLLDWGDLQLQGWASEALATAQIEGEILQLNSVRASVARRLGLDHATPHTCDARTEATLDLLQAALADITQPLTHDMLHGWQAALFPTRRSGVQKIRVGAWRDHAEPMQIVTPRLGQPDVVHDQAPASADVPAQMAQLLAGFNRWPSEPQERRMDGLVRAAIVHLWFEAVHPYEDGNGRIGRALSELALAQDLGMPQRLWSLSHQMWQDRAGYYAQLQAATGQPNVDVTAWVQWFVRCVQQAAEAALAPMQQALNKTRFATALRNRHPFDDHASQGRLQVVGGGPRRFYWRAEHREVRQPVQRVTRHRLSRTAGPLRNRCAGANGNRTRHALPAEPGVGTDCAMKLCLHRTRQQASLKPPAGTGGT